MSGEQMSGTIDNKLEAAWRLLEATGQSSSADRIREGLDASALAPPTVVVVGETKRGKSSLVNALLGTEIAPVGVDVVTGAYVSYVPAAVECEVPVGTGRIVFADQSVEDVALDDVAGWVTIEGANAMDERGVIAATARLSGPARVDMVLVDTPGVGGLHAGHGALALRAARQAAVLLFVTDVGSDLTAPEAAFLEQAAATVNTVIFAITKIDKHPVSWQKSVDHDRSLIAQRFARFRDADVVGVSSTLGVEASRAADPVLAEALLEASRIGELIAALTTGVSATSEQLALSNATRATSSALRNSAALLTERISAVKDAEPAARAATSEQEQLRELKQHQRRWGREFDLAMSRQRRALLEALSQRIPGLENTWRTNLAALPGEALRSEEQLGDLLAEFSGDVALLSAELLESYLDGVTQQVQELLERDAKRAKRLAEGVRELVEAGPIGPADAELPPIAKQPLSQHLMRGMAGHFLVGVGSTVLAPFGLALGAALAFPATLGAGALMVATSRKASHAEAVRGQLREHLSKTLQRAQSAVLLHADSVASELRPLLLQAMEDHIDERIEELNEVIKEATRAARAEPKERAKQVQPLQRLLKTVLEAATDLEAMLDPPAPGTLPPFDASKEHTTTGGPEPC